MDRAAFLADLYSQFPELDGRLGNHGGYGIFHCEISDFRGELLRAMDEGKLWNVERYLRFIETCLAEANEEVANAIDVSFIEELALSNVTSQRKSAIKDRASKQFFDQLVEHNPDWR
ncbi:MAG: hypothetical protein AAFX76_07920 [Planctomycetota bacterium]